MSEPEEGRFKTVVLSPKTQVFVGSDKMRSETTSLDDYVAESDTVVPAAALARAVPYTADSARSEYSSSALYRARPPQGSNQSLYARFPSTSTYDQNGGGYQPALMPYAAAEQAIASYSAAKSAYLG